MSMDGIPSFTFFDDQAQAQELPAIITLDFQSTPRGQVIYLLVTAHDYDTDYSLVASSAASRVPGCALGTSITFGPNCPVFFEFDLTVDATAMWVESLPQVYFVGAVVFNGVDPSIGIVAPGHTSQGQG